MTKGLILNHRRYLVAAVLSILVLALLWLVYSSMIENRVQNSDIPQIVDNNIKVVDFKTCVDAGNPVMESYPEQCSANGVSYINEEQANNLSQTVTSGLSSFELDFPLDWGEIIKGNNSDIFLIFGTSQPEGPLQITEQEILGSDAPVTLIMGIYNTDEVYIPENGHTSEFLLKNGDNENIVGTKTVIVYETDEVQNEAGIGALRKKNDKDYFYRFKLSNGKTFVVNYHVFSDDPRNMVNKLEVIIDSVKIL